MTRTTIRILTLDDEIFMHKRLARMLAKLGFTEVTACDNGAEALERVAAPLPPDLILLDLNMPGRDGIEFVRKLVEHGYTGSVILVSGEDERVLKSTVHLIQAHRITLTRVVLTGALAQAAAWRQAGLNLRVAVNLSMDSFSSVAADFVAGAVAAAEVAPQDIILEVTESRLMLDQRAPLEVLTRLRMKRFRLSIDDFGTGHSSLSQLRDFPFDELKIDRSFVHGASRDKTLRAMYATSLGLGKLLGMEVVAEGVEDRDDWDLVRDTGCALAQGYFIARPMPAADLAGWIPTWRQRVREFAGDVS